MNRPTSASSQTSSTSNDAEQQQNTGAAYALHRVRGHFHQCPVVYSDDPLELPQPVFPVTDFISSISSGLIEDIADAFLQTVKRLEDNPDVLVGVANRSVGCIVHELARRTNLPYSLCNWYPEGSIGETRVATSTGFSGNGTVYMNGVRPGDRVLLVIDLLRSGKNLADLLRACHRAGATVVGCFCVCEIVEFPGREQVRGFFDESCPLHVLAQVSARGERTKVIGTEGAGVVMSPPKTASITRLCVDDVLAMHNTISKARKLYESDAQLSAFYVPLTREEITAKLKRVAEPFYNIPIVANPNLKYPYCFFQLTDCVPLITHDVIEDMADLCVRHANFNRCDVIVSESDRGGAPLAVAISRRTGKPFVLASWTTHVDSQVSDGTSVGFSGHGRFFISGVKNGERCIFVDDMLSSGGTACGILGALARCGAVCLEAIFVSEKLLAPNTEKNQTLPTRAGFNRLKETYPEVEVSTLVQFCAYGEKTEPPSVSVG